MSDVGATPPRMNEAQLQRLILGHLERLEGVFVWRANAGRAHTGAGRMVSFGIRGQSDILGVLRGGRALCVEVKADRGALTLDQIKFRDRVTALGALYVVARSLDDALAPVRAYLAEAR